MSFYYPQAGASIRILWENFSNEFDFLVQQEYAFSVTPKRTKVSINDYTKADTFSIDLDWKNFPFDPRTIRAVGVTLFIEDMLKTTNPDGSPIQIEPKDAVKIPGSVALPGAQDNIVFLGFADEDTIVFNEDSRIVTLEGRDYTALFIDTPYDNKKPISLALPLDAVYQQLLLSNPATQQIILDNRTGAPLPVLAAFAPDFNPLATERGKKKNENYWDVIQELARRAGLVVYIELDKLVVTKPRGVYKQADLKQFIWGHNLSSLRFKRKLGRVKNFNLEVRSMHIEKKQVLIAQIPRDATASWSLETGIPRKQVKVTELQPNGEKKEKIANVMSFRLPDVASKDQLIEIGEGVYEEISRQQIEGSLSTKDMCVVEGEPPDFVSIRTEPVEFDVTKIRNGTPVSIQIQSEDMRAIERLATPGERYLYLISKCYPADVALAMSGTLGKFSTNFYTKAVEFTVDSEQGFTMDLDFINFIENMDSLI